MTRVIPEQVQDVINELGNIGIGSAATALSDLIEQPVITTNSSISPIEQEYAVHKRINDQVIGALFPFDKDLTGYALFIMEKEVVTHLLRKLLYREEVFEELDRESSGMLQEVTGLMISSYLRGIAEACGVSIRIQLPSVIMDMRGSILNEAFSLMLAQDKDAYWLEHDFTLEGVTSGNHLLFMLPKKSIDVILDKLEVRV